MLCNDVIVDRVATYVKHQIDTKYGMSSEMVGIQGTTLEFFRNDRFFASILVMGECYSKLWDLVETVVPPLSPDAFMLCTDTVLHKSGVSFASETQRAYLARVLEQHDPDFKEALTYDAYDRLGNFQRIAYHYTRDVTPVTRESILTWQEVPLLEPMAHRFVESMTAENPIFTDIFSTMQTATPASFHDYLTGKGLIAEAATEFCESLGEAFEKCSRDAVARAMTYLLTTHVLHADGLIIFHAHDDDEATAMELLLKRTHTRGGLTFFPNVGSKDAMNALATIASTLNSLSEVPGYEEGTEVVLHPRYVIDNKLAEGNKAIVVRWWHDWADSSEQVALDYKLRQLMGDLPNDENVLCVTTDGHQALVHVSEVELL